MNSIVIRLFVLACTFGAALLGMLLRAVLPERHLSGDSKETVRLGMGMVATMAALVLGLLSLPRFDETKRSPARRCTRPCLPISSLRLLIIPTAGSCRTIGDDASAKESTDCAAHACA